MTMMFNYKVKYLIPRKYSTFWRSILYSPVDLTGNVNMIEKLDYYYYG